MRAIRDVAQRVGVLAAALSALLEGSACHGEREVKGAPAKPLASGPAVRAEPTPLVLERALPLELEGDVEGEFQPSGLLLHEGQLLAVSDKHDRAVYVIDLSAGPVNVRPFVRFEPPADEPRALDFEGLSAAPGGGWLLVSESRNRVLRLALDAAAAADSRRGRVPVGRARWLTPSLQAEGRATGCLQTPNAGLEGVALAASGQIVLAAEREERCLIDLGDVADPATARFWSMQQSAYPYDPPRHPDYSDLTALGGDLYALARYVHLLVHLERTERGYREGRAFSYRDTENDPRYAYVDRTFGLGEGLAIGARQVFVVLDNNGQPRAADAADHRPLLFVFERPPDL